MQMADEQKFIICFFVWSPKYSHKAQISPLKRDAKLSPKSQFLDLEHWNSYCNSLTFLGHPVAQQNIHMVQQLKKMLSVWQFAKRVIRFYFNLQKLSFSSPKGLFIMTSSFSVGIQTPPTPKGVIFWLAHPHDLRTVLFWKFFTGGTKENPKKRGQSVPLNFMAKNDGHQNFTQV